jgi:L-alanine-DL-glutamate epimerase-like enolase superfamily enzyme
VKIVDIQITPFKMWADRYFQTVPKPRTEITQTITKIITDEGAEGYYLGGQGHGDQDGLSPANRAYIMQRIKPMIVGQDPLDRERFWQWMSAWKIQENVMGVIDMALYDLAGRVAGMPVYKLLGGCRDKVKAYASTYPNMDMPDNYARHALECKKQGYKAYKIHPYYYWNPDTKQSVPGRPSHIKWDIKCCEAVREAVGDDMVLMYDPWGTYHIYEEALQVGRVLERLGFVWYEHPMPEYRVAPYIKLAKALDIPILSPEIAEGNLFTRADWILREASDQSRLDVLRGGITAVKKTVAVCEAFGVKCEVHMSGFANLQVLGSTSEDTCEWYEKGLLAPGVDYDAPLGYVKKNPDAIDSEGNVHMPTLPGLGYDIDWDYIKEHEVKE